MRVVAELTTTQFEELQATMEGMQAKDTHHPAIGMGHGGKLAIVNREAALPRALQTRGGVIPGRVHPGSSTGSRPAAMDSLPFVATFSSANSSLAATANDPQKASSFPIVVRVDMADDATVVAQTPASGFTQNADAVADSGVFPEQQCAVLVLLLEVLPDKVVAQHFSMTERAAKEHDIAVIWRLGVTRRKQAILIAKRQPLAQAPGCKHSRTNPGARDDNSPTRQVGTITSAPPAGLGLTQRQGTVLNLLLEGLSNKLIARRLGLAVNTVKEHVSAILQRLDLRSRAEVISLLELRVGAEQTGGSLSLTAAPAGVQDRTTESAQRTQITPEAMGLTQRQGSVLILLLEGLPNKVIARRLGLTENTVKQHVSGILQRLRLRTRTEAISRMKRYHVRHMATVGQP